MADKEGANTSVLIFQGIASIKVEHLHEDSISTCSQNIREGIFLTNGLYDRFSYFEFIWKICVPCNLVFIFHYVGILVALCERVLCFVSGLVRKFPIAIYCTKLSELPRESTYLFVMFLLTAFSVEQL